MKSEEPTCALRALTLCDGQVAAGLPPRSLDAPCYCTQLAGREPSPEDTTGQQIRINRARVLAQSSEIERIRRWRQIRW